MQQLTLAQRLAATRVVAQRWAHLLVQIEADRAEIARPLGLGTDAATRERLKRERRLEAHDLAGALASLAGERLPRLEPGRFLKPDPAYDGRLAYHASEATAEIARLVGAALAQLEAAQLEAPAGPVPA
jgi:hypothetical protein